MLINHAHGKIPGFLLIFELPISRNEGTNDRDYDLRNKESDYVCISLIGQSRVLVSGNRAIHLDFGILACVNNNTVDIWSVSQGSSSEKNVVVVEHDLFSFLCHKSPIEFINLVVRLIILSSPEK
jgi:hypothetical protein